MRFGGCLCIGVALLVVFTGCGGSGNGSGGDMPGVDAKSTMYSFPAFPLFDTESVGARSGDEARNGIGTLRQYSILADVNEDGLDDLIGAAFDPLDFQHTPKDLFLRLGSAQTIFGPYTALTTGVGPGRPAAGDINGDGHIDLIFTYNTSTSRPFIRAMFGRGDGTFEDPISVFAYGQGRFGVYPWLADLDRDGDLDIVICLASPTAAVALLNDGHGVFTPVESPLSGEFGIFLVPPADFNDDGLPDIFGVFTTASGPEYRLAINRGAGAFTESTFQFEQAIGYPFLPNGIADTADLDGDGRTDIVAASTNGRHTSYLSKGDGTFTVIDALRGYTPVWLCRVMDVYGDASPDLIVGVDRLPLGVLEGRGDGTFGPDPVIVAGRGFALDCVSGDFDRDGYKDLYADALFNGQPGGGFVSDLRSEIPSGVLARSLAAVDLNSDGSPDLVALGETSFATLLSNGDGTFNALSGSARTARGIPIPGSSPVYSADFNGDGLMDVFCHLSFLYPPYLVLNRGDGTMEKVDVGTVFDTNWSAPADLDDDGYPDLVPSSNFGLGYVFALFGNGDGTFAARQVLDSSPGILPITADLDGNGRPSLLVYDINADTLRTFEAQPDRTFVEGVSLPLEKAAAAYRIDGDGFDDFVSINSVSRSLDIYYGRADGGLDAGDSFALNLDALYEFSITIAPLDNTGKPYILINQQVAGSFNFTPWTLTVLRPTGPRSFEVLTPFTHAGRVADGWHVADLTKDSIPDLLFSSDENSPFGQVEILAGRGDGTFDAPLYFVRDTPNNYSTVLGDWDNDGDIDLASTSGTEVIVKLNKIE